MQTPLQISRQLLTLLGTRTFCFHADRVPRDSAVVVISNHRSFMDAPLLMSAIDRPIRFACHHYMGQVPVMREVVTRLGCFPLDEPQQRQQSFFHQAIQLLQTQQVVGVFPEGAQSMVKPPKSRDMGEFQRGFAHLALRAPLADLAVLPVAIAAQTETTNSAIPLRVLSLFDPSEPLFQSSSWHPMIVYQRVNLLVGNPIWITPVERQAYQGKQAKTVVADLTHRCQSEISNLLRSSL
ncbi:1-acyl-sn-glycerol-3-phosphate acyltransferase [Phormidium tenue FACHB-886]|nr:1-acyl-sn-glycerol-3-phosphate acyltransferase [Phormidium tenue FACHB-886]